MKVLINKLFGMLKCVKLLTFVNINFVLKKEEITVSIHRFRKVYFLKSYRANVMQPKHTDATILFLSQVNI